MTPPPPPFDVDAVLAHMPTPVVVLDVGTGEAVYANPAARRLELAYRPAPGWTVTDPAGHPVAAEAMPHAEARRRRSFDGRLVRFERDGRALTLRFHAHPLGERHAVLTFDDVTELDRSQHELRAAVEARDELVSMAAHELRSPIGALQLVAERICRKATALGPAGEELTRLAGTANRQTRRLHNLVANMLDVSQIRAGQFALEREPAALADVVEQACEPMAEQASAAGVALVVELTDRGEGRWDRQRMEQVVVNLVGNALKYGHSPIHVGLRRVDGQVELAVTDAGPGVPPERQAGIFEPYRRADQRHAARSLGLGLFIVREIVHAHGGEIGLRSRPGATAFTIRLPVQEVP